jgi:hypothetical protein
MTRLDKLREKVAAGETIDGELEAALAALQFARQGEMYAEEMIELLRSFDQTHVNTSLEEQS